LIQSDCFTWRMTAMGRFRPEQVRRMDLVCEVANSWPLNRSRWGSRKGMKISRLLHAALASIVASLLLLASPAKAAERFDLIWMIDPVEPALIERTVKPGDVLAEARLMPIGLVTNDSDAVAADGKVAAASGTQFTVLRANLRSAC